MQQLGTELGCPFVRLGLAETVGENAVKTSAFNSVISIETNWPVLKPREYARDTAVA